MSADVKSPPIRATQPASIPVSTTIPFHRVHRLWKPTPDYLDTPWRTFVRFIEALQQRGARFITFSQAYAGEYDPNMINIILDHHIDYYPIETEVMCRWELEHGVISNVFLFNEFNYDDTPQRRLWTVDDLNIPFYQSLEAAGFEIGYHQNAVGLTATPEERRAYRKELPPALADRARTIFARDVDALRQYFDVRSFIPHGAGEGNARLIDLPPGYDDTLNWVYNNRTRNGTVKPEVRWQNWTDSCRQHPQLIKAQFGTYQVRMDNLPTKGWLAGPGLHHVLVHPGRFGRGMPYELYEGDSGSPATTQIGFEFDLGAFGDVDLPVRIDELIAAWESPAARRAREARWTDADAEWIKALHGTSTYRVLSDDVSVIRETASRSSHAVPYLLHHSRYDVESRDRIKRGALDDRYGGGVERLEHDDPVRGDEAFIERFDHFVNHVHSHRAAHHLGEEDLPFDVVVLRSVPLESFSWLRSAARALYRLRNARFVAIRFVLPKPLTAKRWAAKLEKRWREAAGVHDEHSRCAAFYDWTAGDRDRSFTVRRLTRPADTLSP